MNILFCLSCLPPKKGLQSYSLKVIFQNAFQRNSGPPLSSIDISMHKHTDKISHWEQCFSMVLHIKTDSYRGSDWKFSTSTLEFLYTKHIFCLWVISMSFMSYALIKVLNRCINYWIIFRFSCFQICHYFAIICLEKWSIYVKAQKLDNLISNVFLNYISTFPFTEISPYPSN